MEINMLLPQEDCTGCAACMNQCPASCISMRSDPEGFLRPEINTTECLACGACRDVCPVLKPQKIMEKTDTSCYAAWSRDPNIRFQSTSGGVFTHLAQAILNQGGCVVGARYRTDHLVEHAIVTTEPELEALRQSKYVQSEIGLIYRDIESKLKRGFPVLFSGTPCQCAGLQAYLNQDYESLYLCDFICRGVNSPKIYLSYLRELEERYGAPIKQIWFKNKTYGWNNFCTKIIFRNGLEYLADRETDPFMLGYIKSKLNLYMRPSCYQCKFKGMARPVDITLGDFWGVQLQNTDVDSGVSAVMLHSSKGKFLFEKASEMLYYEERKCNQLLSGNRCILESVSMTTERDHFWNQSPQKIISFSKTISTFYRKESFMNNNVVRLKDTKNMRNLTVLVTSKCTLKCKLCATYASRHPNPSHYSYETLTKSVARYFDSVPESVGLITVSGGEPFLHPQLPEIMEFIIQYADRVRMIEIITNAAIVPNDRLLTVLSSCKKINLLVDNYGEKLSVNLGKLTEKLDSYGIAYRVRNYTKEDSWCDGWLDVSDFTEKNRQDAEIEALFRRCAFNNIYSNIDFLINGRVHMCYAIHEALPEVEELPNESVDLLDNKLDREEIWKQIIGLRNRKYILACKNCNGYLTDGEHKTPAEQIERK